MGHSRRCRWVGHWEYTAALTDSSIAAADCVPTYLHDRGWHPHGCAGTTAAARWQLRLGLADGASVPERAHRDDRARAVHLHDSAYRIVRRGLGMRDGKNRLGQPPPCLHPGGYAPRTCRQVKCPQTLCARHTHPPPPPPPPTSAALTLPGEPEDDRVRRLGGMVRSVTGFHHRQARKSARPGRV